MNSILYYGYTILNTIPEVHCIKLTHITHWLQIVLANLDFGQGPS